MKDFGELVSNWIGFFLLVSVVALMLMWSYNHLAVFIPQAPQDVRFVDAFALVLFCRAARKLFASWKPTEKA
jgi:hypothetical protein